MDRARDVMDVTIERLVARHGLRRLLLIQPGSVGLQGHPILPEGYGLAGTRPILEDFIQGVTATSWMRR